MSSYTTENMVVLAKRYHNTKRTYLLVNPLQAKHLPVSPTKSLGMMACLGEQIAKKYPAAKLVIGFAETATAISAVVAGCLDADCKYIHTTRELNSKKSDCIFFDEEHSHAVEQKLYSKKLAEWICETPQIIFVDDEISTGKTSMNIIRQLRETFPQAKNKKIVMASIINGLSPEQESEFFHDGIEIIFLAKLNGIDFTDAVASFKTVPAKSMDAASDLLPDKFIQTDHPFMNPRFGVAALKYKINCQEEAARLSETLSGDILQDSDVLVLGTEECMYPALIFGQMLEKNSVAGSVRCHATTRSPIGICLDRNYPIRSGFKLHSFFDPERETYIYNLSRYDVAIIVTDTTADDRQAQLDLSTALRHYGCPTIISVEGGSHV